MTDGLDAWFFFSNETLLSSGEQDETSPMWDASARAFATFLHIADSPHGDRAARVRLEGDRRVEGERVLASRCSVQWIASTERAYRRAAVDIAYALIAEQDAGPEELVRHVDVLDRWCSGDASDDAVRALREPLRELVQTLEARWSGAFRPNAMHREYFRPYAAAVIADKLARDTPRSAAMIAYFMLVKGNLTFERQERGREIFEAIFEKALLAAAPH